MQDVTHLMKLPKKPGTFYFFLRKYHVKEGPYLIIIARDEEFRAMQGALMENGHDENPGDCQGP